MCVCVCARVFVCLCVFVRVYAGMEPASRQKGQRRPSAETPTRRAVRVDRVWGSLRGPVCCEAHTRRAGVHSPRPREPEGSSLAVSPPPRPTRCSACVPSTPAPLGPLRKICLWHDSRGPSPAWYVSRVVVGELPAGPGRSWLFPAECWLAADRQDGRVARELACLRRGLGFWKVGGTVSPCSTAGPRAGHGSWPCSSRLWLP